MKKDAGQGTPADQMPLFGVALEPVAEKQKSAPPVKVKPTAKQTAKPAPVAARKSTVKAKPKAVSGLVPDGDVRLTANIREDLHLKLKIAAARQRTTIGELIEELVENHI